MILDRVVNTSLGNKPELFNDLTLMSKIEVMCSSPAYLTEPVKPLELKDKQKPEMDSVQRLFEQYYAMYGMDASGIGTLQVGGDVPREITCEGEVIAILKSILFTGTTRNEGIALACRKVFYSLVKLSRGKVLFKKVDLLEVLHQCPDTVEERIVVDAILKTCYTKDDLFRYDVLATLSNDVDIDRYIECLHTQGITTMAQYRKYVTSTASYRKQHKIPATKKYDVACTLLLEKYK